MYYIISLLSISVDCTTVRPLLYAPLLSADFVYPRFLRSKLSMPNFYEIQSNQNLVRPSTADNRGLTL